MSTLEAGQILQELHRSTLSHVTASTGPPVLGQVRCTAPADRKQEQAYQLFRHIAGGIHEEAHGRSSDESGCQVEGARGKTCCSEDRGEGSVEVKGALRFDQRRLQAEND
eukprot:3235698-Rhodomonas_salina.2